MLKTSLVGISEEKRLQGENYIGVFFPFISEILSYLQSVFQQYKNLNQNIRRWINETLVKLFSGSLLKNRDEVTHLETNPVLTKLNDKMLFYLQYHKSESKPIID